LLITRGKPPVKSLQIAFSALLVGMPILDASTAFTKDAKDITVAVIPKVAVPFFDDCNTGAKQSADTLGVHYQWVVPENTQGATQVQILENLIPKKVDGVP